MASRRTIETIYADLRESDLVIDKSGQAWPIEEIEEGLDGLRQEFWLCDPMSKIRVHKIIRPLTDPVKVSRLPTQADEAAKLEADFPVTDPDPIAEEMAGGSTEAEALEKFPDSHATMAEAVAAVEEIGGAVEAEVTAAEVDAANASTEDEPVSPPVFADMTILEMRSHLYLLHGVYAHDLKSRAETMAMHDQAHVDQEAGRLQSAYVPHVHG